MASVPGFSVSSAPCPAASTLHIRSAAGDKQGGSYHAGQMKHPLALYLYAIKFYPITVVTIHFLEAVDLLYVTRLAPQHRLCVRSLSAVQFIVWPPSKLRHMLWKRIVRD